MAAMHALLSAFAPIWVLTGIGYAVGRGGLLGEQAEAVLGRFVFHVAMPAALFTMVSGASPDVFGHPSMVAFAASTAVAAGAGFFLVRRVFGRGRADAAIGAMSSGHVNSANLGIPVAVQVLGDASFVAQVILFQVLVLSPVVLTLVESGTEGADGADGRRPGGGVRRLLTMPLRNPIILASLLGVAVSATGLRLPAAVTHPCDVLGAAAVPTALITLGLSLHRGPGGGGRARRERAETAVVVAVKTLGQPLAALLVAGPLLHLPDHQLLAVVLCAALPTAQNSFIYAREYGLDTGLARDAIVASTLVSMVTLSVAAWALGP
ncbi:MULTISPECIES: AEC family transporter [unclassified Streptomyces]|uniref:AEC family transporter n=1 Tax=unclassified Streptomyces TaxID=2593676 RepID=UPI00037B394B|nr:MULTISPECIES: AEC family transporter [unclassified Streptomyces]MYQ79286.1 AEC family transporter [Streptomyces sp. SID4923]